MRERTKGPWQTGLDRNPKRPGYVLSGGEIIADCEFPEYEAEGIANAAAIVRWENHFDELVKALDQALRQWAMYADIVERDDRTLDAEQSPEGEMYRSAKALLAKVKACPEK
jgi:hypothetical protein